MDELAEKNNGKSSESDDAASENSQAPTCELQSSISISSSVDVDKNFDHEFQKGWLEYLVCLYYDEENI